MGVMTAYAQASDCNDLLGLELTQSVPSTNTYSLWVLVKKETPTIKPYVRIDDGACQQVQLPSASGWEWVSGAQGIIKHSIKGGQHTFKYSSMAARF